MLQTQTRSYYLVKFGDHFIYNEKGDIILTPTESERARHWSAREAHHISKRLDNTTVVKITIKTTIEREEVVCENPYANNGRRKKSGQIQQ